LFAATLAAYASRHSMGDRVSSARGYRDSSDPVRWARAHDIFQSALDLRPDQRQAFVDSSCGDDAALRAEVTSLLASDQAAGQFIEQPAAVLLANLAPPRFRPRLAPADWLGRYEILEFLGAGGIGEVYRARDTRLGRNVAVKLITDPDDPDAGPRLLDEARHASILNHPNICGVYEVDDAGGLPFLVLELVEGPTLHTLLRDRRPSTMEVVGWAKAIAAALEHAHKRGIVHRDLKSANVAISADGTLKVLDFGLSRPFQMSAGSIQAHAPGLREASIAGTLTHIAPEVLRGEPADQRIDLWAFGVMLYEATSGVLPFKGETSFQTANAILGSMPAPLPAHVPPELRRLIERCLVKDPASRLASAAEVCEALNALTTENRSQAWSRIQRPLPVLTAIVAVAAAGVYSLRPAPIPVPPPPVLAVLPLAGDDPAQAFYADGVTEGLIGELGRVEGMRVIAPGTSMRYRTGAAGIRDAARGSGANRLLEGSIVRSGDHLSLSARLLDGASGRVIWSETYRRDAREVQALQATVARAVAKAVEVELTVEDDRHFGAVRAVDPDVYEAYLKGRYYWNQRTLVSIRTAIGHFEAALALDPTYAPAYAALADCYNQLATVMVGGGPPREWRPKAAEAAIKALQVDGDLAEAHATLGFVRHYDWQWTEAERSLRRAIALNPSYALARLWYANLLCSQRRFDEALVEVLAARTLDPLSLIVNTNVGWVLYRARRNDEAIAEYSKALALDPTYLQAHMRLAASYDYAGRFGEAMTEAERVAELSNRSLGSLLSLELTRLRAGQPNDFDRRITELIAALPQTYTSPGAIANLYFGAGRNEEGFRWLDRAFRERTNNMVYLTVEPVYDGVRDDPRFKALVKAVGLE
jgi:TolB-like protein/tetratricopeptide (TPR) repeat protein